MVERSRRLPGGGLAIGLPVLACWFVFHIFQEPDVDMLLLPLEPWPVPTSRCEGNPPVLLVVLKYLGYLAFRGSTSMLFFLFCVPKGRTFFTEFGTRTMYPYLFHEVLVIGLPWWRLVRWYMPYGWMHGSHADVWMKTKLAGCLLILVAGLVCFACTCILSLPWVRRRLHWVVEPSWILNLTTAQRAAWLVPVVALYLTRWESRLAYERMFDADALLTTQSSHVSGETPKFGRTWKGVNWWTALEALIVVGSIEVSAAISRIRRAR